MSERILIVEDDELLRDNITEILISEGYDLISASNGLEGLKEAKRTKPDLIISDIMMPEIDGFEFLEKLLDDQELASTPIIFLTAKADKIYVRKGMHLGADDYITKPFEISDLLDTVKIRLKKSENAKKDVKILQDEITSKVPHELRTPLVPKLGFSEMIGELDDLEEVKSLAKMINKNGKYLHEKIEKFLLYKDLILLERNTENKIATNESLILNDNFLSSLLSEFNQELNSKKRVEVAVEPIEIETSTILFRTLLKELIENGLRYSDLENKVRVSGKKHDDKYEIIITDSGRGMNERMINSLDAFGRFGAEKFYESGLGLGLAISKKVTNYLGFSFKIDSKENTYTRCELGFQTN